MGIHQYKYLPFTRDKRPKNKAFLMIARPTFEEVTMLYEHMFPNANSLQSSSFNQSKEQWNQSTLDQTTDEARNFNDREGFEDVTYDLNDFDCNNESDEENFQLAKTKATPTATRAQKRRNKDRKIRTTITPDKLAEMNRMFIEHQDEKDKGRNPVLNLKEIGHKLDLGYSTILHKFRQFRQNKVVKGGALIESLQKKRKYRKSMDVEKLIQKSLRQRPFYTAVELSKYIHKKYQLCYSRSIISRHLTEMGYSFNNSKPFPLEKNSGKYIEARRLFARIIESYAEDESNFIFADEVAFSINLFTRTCNISSEKRNAEKEADYVSLMVIASNQTIHVHEIKHGFFNRENFKTGIRKAGLLLEHNKRYTMVTNKQFVLLTDTHKLHYQEESNQIDLQNSLSQVLKDAKMRRFFLPPGSPQLNPLQSLFSTIKEKLSKQGIQNISTLKEKLESMMRTIAKEPTHVYFKEFKLWMTKAKNGENY